MSTYYGAFTYSYDKKNILINYIKNQVEHHKVKSFKEEYIEILKEHGVEYEEKYLV
jgi:putative transposase